MPRRLRCDDAGYIFHVLNRAVGKTNIFEKESDYAAFEKVLADASQKVPMRLISYVLMPNHWHFVAWPESDGDLSQWMQWLTGTHVRRMHAHRKSAGSGPVYQGRFKSFPVQDDEHFFTVCRYVERNPLRAGLVKRPEEWRWSSMWHRRNRTGVPWLVDGPLPFPENWSEQVREPQTGAELDALQRCLARGSPFGDMDWQEQTVATLGLQSSLRGRGRPKSSGSSSKKST
jgi:putative transposase